MPKRSKRNLAQAENIRLACLKRSQNLEKAKKSQYRDNPASAYTRKFSRMGVFAGSNLLEASPLATVTRQGWARDFCPQTEKVVASSKTDESEAYQSSTDDGESSDMVTSAPQVSRATLYRRKKAIIKDSSDMIIEAERNRIKEMIQSAPKSDIVRNVSLIFQENDNNIQLAPIWRDMSVDSIVTFLGTCRTSYYAAKYHTKVYGSGKYGWLAAGYTRQKIKTAAIAAINDWFSKSANTKQSSCKTNKAGEPLMYLLDSKSKLYERYASDSSITGPKVKRTFFFKYLVEGNYQRLSLLGSLCAKCDKTGYTILRFCEDYSKQYSYLNMTQTAVSWIAHVRTEQVSNTHSDRATHCYNFACLGSCQLTHLSCPKCNLLKTDILDKLQPIIALLSPTANLSVRFREIERHALSFMAHRLRTNAYEYFFHQELKIISNSHLVMVIDFKQKILQSSFRETSVEYYAKSGFSYFGAGLLLKSDNAQSSTYHQNFIDLWSDDSKQDAEWAISAFDAVCSIIRTHFSTISSFSIFSDNGSHFHNAIFMKTAGIVAKLNGLKLAFLDR